MSMVSEKIKYCSNALKLTFGPHLGAFVTFTTRLFCNIVDHFQQNFDRFQDRLFLDKMCLFLFQNRYPSRGGLVSFKCLTINFSEFH